MNKPKDLFDAKVSLLQCLATPDHEALNSPLKHVNNGKWHEDCPSRHCWHFTSKDGRYGATVNWYSREVVFFRRIRTTSF